MRVGKRFWRDERGTTFEGIALSVAIIAVAFVASADMLDYMVKAHNPAAVGEFAAAPHRQAPVMAGGDALVAGNRRDSNVDYMPTGSLPNSLPKLISRSVLDPCTGASR